MTKWLRPQLLGKASFPQKEEQWRRPLFGRPLGWALGSKKVQGIHPGPDVQPGSVPRATCCPFPGSFLEKSADVSSCFFQGSIYNYSCFLILEVGWE